MAESPKALTSPWPNNWSQTKHSIWFHILVSNWDEMLRERQVRHTSHSCAQTAMILRGGIWSSPQRSRHIEQFNSFGRAKSLLTIATASAIIKWLTDRETRVIFYPPGITETDLTDCQVLKKASRSRTVRPLSCERRWVWSTFGKVASVYEAYLESQT